MNRPRALDLFCGAGGASKGLADAGFEVWGVDLNPMPRYIHPGRFVQGDALNPPFDLRDFDLVWASPPCQRYSITQKIHGRDYPDLIPPTREMLKASGVPYVIENVKGAPLIDPVILCGTMFGLKVIRHRLFEASFFLIAPQCGRHGTTKSKDSYSSHANGAEFITVAGKNYNFEDGKRAMGIDWMQRKELSEAIPPAYAEFIGRAFLRSG